MLQKIIFCDPNKALCNAFKNELNKHDLSNIPVSIEIVSQTFQNLPEFDAIVAAGNSFGVLSGGIDLYIKLFFDEILKENGANRLTQNRVQQAIRNKSFGELPVGSSLVVNTGVAKHPFIIYAPTMRTPLVLGDSTTHVYSSSLSAMISLMKHNQHSDQPIKTVVFAGMGTGAGKVSFETAARQEIGAWLQVLKPSEEKTMKMYDEKINSQKIFPNLPISE